MDKKTMRIFQPGYRLFLLALLLFCGVTFYFSPAAAVVELFLTVILYMYSRRINFRRRRDIMKYIENITYHVDSAAKNSIVNFPLPMSVVNMQSGEIVWANDLFFRASDTRETLISHNIDRVAPGLDLARLMESIPGGFATVPVGDRVFDVYGNMMRSESSRFSSNSPQLATLYWIDMTDLARSRTQLERGRSVVAFIILDSYEEFLKNLNESERSSMLAMINDRLNKWASKINGMFRRYDRDKYLLVMEQQDLDFYIEEKFSLLESLKSLVSSEGIPMTVSIGIGRDGDSLSETQQYANLASEMALSRGGDQVVIKSRQAFEFYGGRTQQPEKRTKVKSRVMSSALAQLMRESSQVLIMGHKVPDIDCIGATAGLCCIARKFARPAHIVLERKNTTADLLLAKLGSLPEYEGSFVSPEEARLMADDNTLLIVVDTNRPDYTLEPALLDEVQRVVVVDHHRRAANYIDNTVLSIHEPYASSACELVAELLQYVVATHDILRSEAEALLAGIYLDTKGFCIKTGARTFEAAAYLKRVGADTAEVKRIFQTDMESYLAKNDIITAMEVLYDGSIGMSVIDGDVNRAVAGQAADEMLGVSGITGSFVVYRSGESVDISARSYGHINVQLILEPLGGGGSLTTAGAQIPDGDVSEVSARLVRSIEKYMSEKQ